jgi:hypothetical protein
MAIKETRESLAKFSVHLLGTLMLYHPPVFLVRSRKVERRIIFNIVEVVTNQGNFRVIRSILG